MPTFIGDLLVAITMAERLDLFHASVQEGVGNSEGSGVQYKGQKDGPWKKKVGSTRLKKTRRVRLKSPSL